MNMRIGGKKKPFHLSGHGHPAGWYEGRRGADGSHQRADEDSPVNAALTS